MRLQHRRPFVLVAANIIAISACTGFWLWSSRVDPTQWLVADELAAQPGRPPVRIACVGDSITYGLHLPERAKTCYPAVLGKWFGPGHQVFNFGVSGATLLKRGDLSYWDQPAFAGALESNPSIVVIQLGTNDTKPANWRYIANFEENYRELIEKFRALPSKPQVFICRPIPVVVQGHGGTNESGIEREIPWIDAVARSERVDEIDLHQVLQDHPDLLPDHVHPSADGAKLIAAAVFQALTGQMPPECGKAGSLQPFRCVLVKLHSQRPDSGKPVAQIPV